MGMKIYQSNYIGLKRLKTAKIRNICITSLKRSLKTKCADKQA